MAKYVWSLVAYVLGASNRPGPFARFWAWISSILKMADSFIWLAWQAYVGPHGKRETISVLKRKSSDLLRRLCDHRALF